MGKTAYSSPTSVKAVYEQINTMSGRLDENKQAVLKKEPAWWVVVLHNGLSINLGAEKPDLKVGQRVKFVLIPMEG